MAEGSFSPEELKDDIQKAAKVEKEQGPLIANPIARFNLNLNDANPDVQPTPESGLEPWPDPTLPEVLKKELSSPEKIADPQTGQQFNVLKLNWSKLEDSDVKRVMINLPSYNNVITKGGTNYRIQELARQIEAPLLVIDHPNMGSDPLTQEQIEGLKSDDGYGIIAEAELRIMQALGIKEITLVGQSMGAWAASSVAPRAEKYGIKVANLVIVDSPGVEEFNPDGQGSEIGMKEIAEGQYLDLYQSRPYDPKLREATGQHLPQEEKNAALGEWVMSAMHNDPDGVYRQAMSKKSLPGLLRRTLATQPDAQVRIINGTISGVSPTRGNAEMAKELREEFPGRVAQSVYPGEPHLVMESAKRFAAAVKRSIAHY